MMSEKTCRVCRSQSISELMAFGMLPVTTVLHKSHSDRDYINDLTLDSCGDCGFVFIRHPILSSEFYDEYHWMSSANPAPHLMPLRDELIKNFLNSSTDLIMEVGSNDGLLLSLFKEKGFSNVLAIEPAQNCAKASRARGIPTLNDYFNEGVARKIKADYGTPKIILCRHVLEHIFNLDSFISSMTFLMKGTETVLALEVPSFEIMSRKGDILLVWEQHINYFEAETLQILCERHGLSVFQTETVPHGGGSLLFHARMGEKADRDRHARTIDAPKLFKKCARVNIQSIGDRFLEIRKQGKKIVAYGAGMRGGCIMNLTKAHRFFECIVDDSQEKSGLFSPNGKLEIKNSDYLITNKPEFCVVMPLSSKETEKNIQAKHQAYVQGGGTFIELFPGDYRDSGLFTEKQLS